MLADRLLRLSDLLDRDAANEKGVKFDLGTWADKSDHSNWLENSPVPVDCGTTACAMGLAAISGEFAKEGLIAHFEPVAPWNNVPYGPPLHYTLYPMIVTTDYRGIARNCSGFEAAEKLFNITEDDAHYLFDSDSYEGTPRGAEGERFVAQRIRDFTEGKIDEQHHKSFRDPSDYDDLGDED